MNRAEFTNKTMLAAWKRARGRCECSGCVACTPDGCGMMFGGKRPRYDHKISDYLGGSNELCNCQVLCEPCDAVKTYNNDAQQIAKARRIRVRHAGIRKPRSMTRWRRFDGSPVMKSRER